MLLQCDPDSGLRGVVDRSWPPKNAHILDPGDVLPYMAKDFADVIK